MRGISTSFQKFARSVFLTLTALAMGSFLASPPNFMLMRGPGASVVLAPCPGQQAMADHQMSGNAMAMPGPMHHAHDGHKKAPGGSMCPMAHFSAVHLSNDADHILQTTTIVYSELIPPAIIDQTPGLGLAAPPPLAARGPPVRV